MQTIKHGKNISEDLIIIMYRWEFMTEDRDIMFHVFYRDENGKKVDVVPKEKVESNLIMEEGEIICFSPRICEYHFTNQKKWLLTILSIEIFNLDVLRFDNSYSYFRSKTVWYWINLDHDDGDDVLNFRKD